MEGDIPNPVCGHQKYAMESICPLRNKFLFVNCRKWLGA